MKARFIYQDEKSNKFWDIETNGTDLTVQYGKVGTTGQSQTKQFASEEECIKAADKLIAEKVKKGYQQLEDAGAGTAYAQPSSTEEEDGFREISYEEALELLGVDQLFDYWDDEDSRYASDYETEREYFEDYITIQYHDGDLHIDGDLTIQDLIIVRGNMDIQGRVSSQYYVTGNTTVDHISLSDFQKTAGQETIRYVAAAWGEDDEVVHTMAYRKIDAPYFFSWHYDLDCYEFAPETVITAVYDYDRLTSYQTNNVFLKWHDYAFVFKPELYYTVERSEYNVLQISPGEVYKVLRSGQSPILDGVTWEGVRLVNKGAELEQENDHLAAYQAYKEAISKSPGYYPAYKAAGKLLYDRKAYAQAMEIYARAIPLTPERVLYEFDCIEKGGVAAIQLGEYEKAVEWCQLAVEKNKDADFPLRIMAEALIYMGEQDTAKRYLERSLGIRSFFTNNWLMGLICFLQGDTKKADAYYKVAAEKSAKARPYTEHKDLKYVYGEPVTLDWDTKKPVSTEKGQEYWNSFLAETLSTYGPDMYSRTGQWPSQWLFGKVAKIPVEFRSKEMLQLLLDHKTNGEPDVSGRLITSFDPAFLTEEIIFQAVQREEPAEYSDIPPQFYTEKLLRVHPGGINLSVIPVEQRSYELCFEAVSRNQHNYEAVPKEFRDERMNIALIAGGGIGQYPLKALPAKYHGNEYIKQAIDTHILAITNIPVPLVDKEVYEHAVERYGKDPMWPFIVERYDRDRWRFGSPSDVEEFGKRVRKYGINIFDHVDINHIYKQSYRYYKKHLGHLPEFAEKVKTYGWEKNSDKVHEYNNEKEFDYDTFRKVWACFWTEDFILKALDRKSDKERLYNVPKKYMTQKICDLAVKLDPYDFEFVPAEFVTESMCKDACSAAYGAALEYVPLAMRTQEICDAAIGRGAENIKFVPTKLRTLQMCASVIAREKDLTPYIPHALYTEVFEWCSKNIRNRFEKNYLTLHWGLGLILDKNYNAAREKLATVEAKATECYHQAMYYTGWSYFLEGEEKTAKEYFTKSQNAAKEGDIRDEDKLTFPYASFQLQPVGEVYPFNKDQFDVQMKEASALVQNGFYDEALVLLDGMEKQLTDAQCSEMKWWAYVWDHKRYALYEAGRQEASYELCHRIIAELGKITLWEYLEEFNIVRAALRAANNNLAYRYYQTATDLAGVKEGLNYIKATMKTISSIEDKSALNIFYETQALLLYKAMGFDPAYRKDLEKVIAKIEKLKLKEAGILSDEFEQIEL